MIKVVLDLYGFTKTMMIPKVAPFIDIVFYKPVTWILKTDTPSHRMSDDHKIVRFYHEGDGVYKPK